MLVTPIRGLYQGWIFEAGTSEQADDDLPWLYCGILYAYDVTHIFLLAPNNKTDYSGGRAFCVGEESTFS